MQSSIARRPYVAVSKKTFGSSAERTSTPRCARRSSWNGPPPARIANTTRSVGHALAAAGEPGEVRRLHLGRVPHRPAPPAGTAGEARPRRLRMDEEDAAGGVELAEEGCVGLGLEQGGRARRRAVEAVDDPPRGESAEAAAQVRAPICNCIWGRGRLQDVAVVHGIDGGVSGPPRHPRPLPRTRHPHRRTQSRPWSPCSRPRGRRRLLRSSTSASLSGDPLGHDSLVWTECGSHAAAIAVRRSASLPDLRAHLVNAEAWAGPHSAVVATIADPDEPVG